MIVDNSLCNEIDAETTVVACSNDYIFRRIDIAGTDNQCLRYTLNAFYKEVDD